MTAILATNASPVASVAAASPRSVRRPGPSPAWRGVLTACRLDFLRLFGGIPAAVAMLCWPIPAAALLAIAQAMGAGDLGYAIGGIIGASFGMTTIMPLTLFTLDTRDDGVRLNGVVPATQAHRVLGRYLLVTGIVAVLAVNLAVVQTIIALTAPAGPDDVWSAVLAVVAVLVAVNILAEALVMPCFYRWGTSALRFIFIAVMGAFIMLPFLAVILVERLPDGMRREVMGAALWLAGHPPVLAAIVVMALVAACAGSLTASLRIVRAWPGERTAGAKATPRATARLAADRAGGQATAGAAASRPRSAAMPPVLRVLRLDLMDLWPDNRSEVLPLLIPFVFLLMVPVSGAGGTLPICAAVTVFMWASSAWGLFQTTTHSQFGRFSALLPVSRGRQVTARWLAIAIAGLGCLMQLAVEAAALVLIDPASLTPGTAAMEVAAGTVVYLLACAIMAPLLYAFDFMRVLQMFWVVMAFVVIGGTIVSAFIPDGVAQAVIGALRALPAGAWLGGAAALAVVGWAVAIPVSRLIWRRREL